jgi:hypothetical protein
LACRLDGLSHLSPPLRWSLALMRHHGGNVLKYQEYCEECRVLPLNPMESDPFGCFQPQSLHHSGPPCIRKGGLHAHDPRLSSCPHVFR